MSIFTIKFNSPKETIKSVVKFFILLQLVTLVYFIFKPVTLWTPIAKVWGQISAWLFLITLIPGIITRFKIKNWLSQIGQTIFYSRAQLGISMFLAAFLHYILKVKSLMQTGNYPPKEIELYFVFGMPALLLSLILAITSNQQSKKFLKKNWFRVHKLTYIILFLTFLHVAVLEREVFTLAFGTVILLELASYAYPMLKKN